MKTYNIENNDNTCDICCVGQVTDASHVCEACKSQIELAFYVGD